MLTHQIFRRVDFGRCRLGPLLIRLFVGYILAFRRHIATYQHNTGAHATGGGQPLSSHEVHLLTLSLMIELRDSVVENYAPWGHIGRESRHDQEETAGVGMRGS